MRTLLAAPRTAVVIGLVLCLVGCPRQSPVVDAAVGDVGTVDAPVRDPAGLYLECEPSTTCAGVDQVCYPVRGGGRDTGLCTYRCTDDTDCPTGICLVDSGTIDDTPRCRERCATDTDCNDPSFGCVHVGIMSTRGSYETDLCYPQQL